MRENRSERSFAKQAAMQLAAGGSAGCVEVCLMHPLDLVKTRLQLQTTSKNLSSDHYRGVGDCMKKMLKHEGIFSFWKGVIPPILVETPKRAWKFFTFEQFKIAFEFYGDQSKALTYAMAGLGSGVTEAIIVNPFEVVKVKMQSNRSHQPSTGFVMREIIREEGIGKLLGKGITATIGRNGTFNMVYFGFYHTFREKLPQSEDPTLEFFRKFGIGLAAGTLASCINIPFDVAKSRIQGPQPLDEKGQMVVRYRGTFRTIAIVYRNEGFSALYKGLLPKMMRLGPGGGIMLLVYEYVFKYLDEKY